MAKYQDALPLYRQEKILQRIGVDIPRATLANWMTRLGALIQPLINLIQDKLLAYDILGMDETLLQVLKEPGEKPLQTPISGCNGEGRRIKPWFCFITTLHAAR